MTDIAALAKRLRDQAESYDDRAGMLERQAADALEALQAERDLKIGQLQASRQMLAASEGRIKELTLHGLKDFEYIEHLEARAEKAEAELESWRDYAERNEP